MNYLLQYGVFGVGLIIAGYGLYALGYRHGRKAVKVEAEMAIMRTERVMRQADRRTLPREGNAGPARQDRLRFRRGHSQRES